MLEGQHQGVLEGGVGNRNNNNPGQCSSLHCVSGIQLSQAPGVIPVSCHQPSQNPSLYPTQHPSQHPLQHLPQYPPRYPPQYPPQHPPTHPPQIPRQPSQPSFHPPVSSHHGDYEAYTETSGHHSDPRKRNNGEHEAHIETADHHHQHQVPERGGRHSENMKRNNVGSKWANGQNYDRASSKRGRY